MTARTPTALKLFFQTGSRPSQSNFGDVMDSYINTVQTGAQSIISDVSALGTLDVSGSAAFKSNVSVSGNLVIGGSLSTAGGALTISSLSVTGSAAFGGPVNVSANINVIGNTTLGSVKVSADSGNITGSSFTATGSTIPANGLYLPAASTPGISANSKLVSEFITAGTSVNFWTLTNAATGIAPALGVTGTDSNVNMSIKTKGTGSFQFSTTNGIQFYVIDNGSTVANQFQIQGASTGNPPRLLANGSDTNIDLNIFPQGAGVVQIGNAGSFAANGSTATAMSSVGPAAAHTTVQKWLTIKDNAGSTFYIPCF